MLPSLFDRFGVCVFARNVQIISLLLSVEYDAYTVQMWAKFVKLYTARLKNFRPLFNLKVMIKINLLKHTSINSVHCLSPKIGRAHRGLRNISNVLWKPILCIKLIFSTKMHGAMEDGEPIQLMEIPYNESCLLLVTEYIADIMDVETIQICKFQNEVTNSAFGASLIARWSTWCTVFHLVYGRPAIYPVRLIT